MLRLYFEAVLFHSHPWKRKKKKTPSGPTGPVTAWHACCTRLPLRCKCWGYEGGHRGGPPTIPPHRRRSQVGGLSQTEARHIVQIIYGLCRLKSRWSRGVSLSSLALSPCTTFRPGSRFSVFWVVLIHKFPHFLGGSIDLNRMLQMAPPPPYVLLRGVSQHRAHTPFLWNHQGKTSFKITQPRY